MEETSVLRIQLPDDVVRAIRSADGGPLSDEERIRVPLAIGLFAKGAISLAKAASLAEMTRYDFGRLLKEIGLPAKAYTRADYEEDMVFVASAMEQ